MTLDKREFLLLAKDYEPKKHDVSGWWASEKLDGHRAFWDGGISRGLMAAEVPYANVAKDHRLKDVRFATGLWSRYGHPIHAPSWFLDELPIGTNLDGELWIARGKFQLVSTTCKKLVPVDEEWKLVKFCIIDAPAWESVLMDGELTGANWKGILHQGMLEWVARRTGSLGLPPPFFQGFGQPDECFMTLGRRHQGSKSWEPMVQVRLPKHPDAAREQVAAELHRVAEVGGEGLILRSNTGMWYPKRVAWLLKAKKLNDAEGTVTGFTWGRITALGSRHLGRMGALILDYQGKRLELSGFTDEERQVVPSEHAIPQYTHVEEGEVPSESILGEGKDASADWQPKFFPKGTSVTFTYFDHSDDGIPKGARYFRERVDL